MGRARPDLAPPAGDVPGVAGDPQPETVVLLRRHRHAAAHDLPARGQRVRPDRPLHICEADLRRDRRPHPAAHLQPPPGPHRRPLLHPDHARRADVRALPFAGAFDLAVSFGALGHFLPAERPALFAGVYRALRPGGVLAVPIGAPQPVTSGWRADSRYPVSARIVGEILIAAGAGVLICAFAQFVIGGLGILAPTAATERLVVNGLYRYIRNPMYLVVLAVIGGQALMFSRPVLQACAAVVGAAFGASPLCTLGHNYALCDVSSSRY